MRKGKTLAKLPFLKYCHRRFTLMQTQFETWKKQIADFLNSEGEKFRFRLKKVHPLGEDAVGRLVEFACQGKMIRGGLVCLAHGIFRGRVSPEAVQAAAAIELFQSSLLVHDDIMDGDKTRRGNASVYFQYQNVLKDMEFTKAEHTGSSLGICVGDIAIFLAFEILSQLPVDLEIKNRLISETARELGLVGVAQMADVYRGAALSRTANQENLLFDTDLSAEEETLRMYLYKTGRYTFSLPLMCGAMLASADETDGKILELAGEKMGILFQLRDDELGLFGDEDQVGKPVGSDIREGKQTLYYHYLKRELDKSGNEALALFGKPELTDTEINLLKTLIEQTGVRDAVVNLMKKYAAEARDILGNLSGCDDRYLSYLFDLIEFTQNRTR